MKFISFLRLGTPGFGIVKDQALVDLTGRLSPHIVTLKQAIAAGILEDAADFADRHKPDFAFSDITFLPVIPDPSKILCVGLNYQKHKAETGRPDVDNPTIFTRFADSQVGHRQALIKPKATQRFDYEGELAVVIGQGGRHIGEHESLSHIAGYACYNDGTARDWQRHTSQFTPGKTFPGTGGFGPYLVTPDAIDDHTKIPVETRVNGEVRQQATLADLIFPLPTLIAYVSAFTPLSAGDVIVTGTPGGIGDRRDPPVYLGSGDVVEVDLGPVGTLVNSVIDEEDL